MRASRWWVVAVAAGCVTSGCAATSTVLPHDQFSEHMVNGARAPGRQALVSAPRASGEARTFVCVDLSLDAGIALADRVLADARDGRGPEVEGRTVELAARMRQTMSYLRQSTARLCQQWLAGRTPVDSRLAQYEALVETAERLAQPTLAAGSSICERCEEQ